MTQEQIGAGVMKNNQPVKLLRKVVSYEVVGEFKTVHHAAQYLIDHEHFDMYDRSTVADKLNYTATNRSHVGSIFKVEKVK